jgi:hypothetical protein
LISSITIPSTLVKNTPRIVDLQDSSSNLNNLINANQLKDPKNSTTNVNISNFTKNKGFVYKEFSEK